MTSQIALIFGLGGTELILILLVVLLLFGAKKIPELARGLGSGIREFKDASREIKREIETDHRPEAKTSTPRQNAEN
jgi:sec-independent protein translocase protein TatA